MKYAVTFCTFDGEAGANPLWHSCILLSRMDEETKQLEVVDNWGFYGLPTTQRDNSWINKLKLKIGMDVDLVGNHGMLRHEEIRYLDLGRGLHGTTFELTQEQFELLQNKCLEMVEQQESAIKEIVEPLKIVGKPPKETRIYPFEQHSPDIYRWEKIRAAQDQREPRLKPFEVRVSWGWSGPSLAESNTCKTQSLALLKHVLSDEQIHRLTDGGKHPTVPRYSGPMETIYLHSTGPLRQHEKKSGDKVFYRDSKDPGVRLYWTVPPQEVEALSDDTIKLLSIDKEYCPKVKSVVRKLQQLEWLLRNAKVPEEFQKNQDALINQVIACYKSFSRIKPKDDKPSITGVQGFFYSLLSLPRSLAEQRLQEKIKSAEHLFNGLYMALVHRMKIDQNLPIEPIDELNSEDEQSEASCSYEQVELIDENPLEAVVSYLSMNEQIALCRIIGRNYCIDDESEDEYSIPEENLYVNHETNENSLSPR